MVYFLITTVLNIHRSLKLSVDFSSQIWRDQFGSTLIPKDFFRNLHSQYYEGYLQNKAKVVGFSTHIQLAQSLTVLCFVKKRWNGKYFLIVVSPQRHHSLVKQRIKSVKLCESYFNCTKYNTYQYCDACLINWTESDLLIFSNFININISYQLELINAYFLELLTPCYLSWSLGNSIVCYIFEYFKYYNLQNNSLLLSPSFLDSKWYLIT